MATSDNDGMHACCIVTRDTVLPSLFDSVVREALAENYRISFYSDLFVGVSEGGALTDWLDDLRHCTRQQQVLISTGDPLERPRDRSASTVPLAPWVRLREDALQAGYRGILRIGEPVRGADRAGVLEYEREARDLITDPSIAAVCVYDRAITDPALLWQILRLHPSVLCDGGRVHNPLYAPSRGSPELALDWEHLLDVDLQQLGQLLTDRGPSGNSDPWRALLDAVPGGIAVQVDRRVVYANPALAAVVGEPPGALLGRDLFDYGVGRAEPVASSCLRMRLQRSDGEVREVELQSTGVRWRGQAGRLLAVRDITRAQEASRERTRALEVTLTRLQLQEENATRFAELAQRERVARRLLDAQQQERKAEKLTSLGLLAEGTAQEFRNLYMGLMGQAELALEHIPEDSPARECLEAIQRAADRARQHADRLLTYAGGIATGAEVVALGPRLSEWLEEEKARCRPGLRFHVQLPEALPTVVLDGRHLRALLGHLLENARDAMTDTGSEVCVRALITEPGAPLPEHYVGERLRADARWLHLVVEDDGEGIRPDVSARLLDPFVSTRAPGRGFGLPLALGLCRILGGGLAVTPRAAGGARAQVWLPLTLVDEV